jgi:hypothetical protein
MSNSIQAEFILKLFAGKEHNEEMVPELANVGTETETRG